jgi:nitrogen fixation NifU-like protein
MTGNNFEKFTKELQRKIEDEEEKKYSKVVISEYRNPNNFRDIDKSDSIGKIKGPCGDTMKISLKINNDKITNAFFWTDGCGATIACGSMITKMVKGISLEKAKIITSEKLITALEGLPENHLHCSKLVINTLKKAISNYRK